MTKKKTTLKIKAPDKDCKDSKCPFHGSLKTRGRVFVGVVTSKDTHRTATVVFERKVYVPKYERYLKKRSKIHVHNPSCIDAKPGDFVKIVECRPLSKTKKFVAIEMLGKDILFKQKEEALESAKIKEKKEEDTQKEKETESKEGKKLSNEGEKGLEKAKTFQKEKPEEKKEQETQKENKE
ncbi:30S ribosomal protein S17 [Candidatus Woesearchaeota archaeon]|nr:30S ribosomal protein S17 [Candidatus Woesearchaeota archaeon]|tara:strand:+ start:7228 stop:7770 length:543 start_codon:yes stop_codon:yes gene_type:complete